MKHLRRLIRRFYKRNRREFLIVLLAVLSFLLFVPLLTYAYFAKDLKSKDTIMNRNDTGLILEDRTGKPFFTFYQAKYRNFVALSEISPLAQKAVIAGEDKNFYTEPGFSVTGIVRSLFTDIRKQGFAQGGSTITQQLVKNSLLSSKKSFLRKYQEISLASEITRRYTKNEILEMYLNSVYFGNGAFGIDEASQYYFGKHANELDLSQASYLGGILPAPSSLSQDISQARQRQKYVLDNMRDLAYITPLQEQEALSEKISFVEKQSDINVLAPHFALMVQDQLIKQYGEERISRSGFRVKTTLDVNWQKYAEATVADQVAKLKGDLVTNGAEITLDPKTGEVRSLVGSHDWNDPDYGKLNIVTTTRQVGSSFKPIVYSDALENELITPASILQDVPTTFQPDNYKPLDYDRKFRGPVTVRRALSNSLNIPSVEVMQKVGLQEALAHAQDMGITTLGTDTSQYGLSLVLGPGPVKLEELTAAYAVFANQGLYNPPTIISEIDDKNGRVVYKYMPKPRQAISPQSAFLISSILSDNVARSEEFGNLLTISRTAAVKTGTTEDFRDALTLGFTPSLVVGVWVGNNDNHPMDNIAGSLGAAPIWKSLMERYLKGSPDEKFPVPSGIVGTVVCRSNGLLSKQASSSAFTEFFIQGTEPTRYCNDVPLKSKFTPPASISSPPITITEVPITSLPIQTLQEVTQAPVKHHGKN